MIDRKIEVDRERENESKEKKKRSSYPLLFQANGRKENIWAHLQRLNVVHWSTFRRFCSYFCVCMCCFDAIYWTDEKATVKYSNRWEILGDFKHGTRHKQTHNADCRFKWLLTENILKRKKSVNNQIVLVHRRRKSRWHQRRGSVFMMAQCIIYKQTIYTLLSVILVRKKHPSNLLAT